MKLPNEARVVWIGLVQIGPEGLGGLIEEDAKGAYVNALALARNDAEYRKKVISAVQELGLTAEDFEDIQRFAERIRECQVDQELINLASRVDESDEVLFGTFHTFEQEVH